MCAVVREPAVAGHFYPGSPEALLQAVRSYSPSSAEKIRALGCMVPHAGYMYSGHVAGAVYGKVELPRRFIILGPNHTGRGRPLAIMSHGAWQTPLGDANIDSELAEALKNAFPYLEEDDMAHRGEHAIEVQLPFLQEALGEFSFVPIALGTSHYPLLAGVGHAVVPLLKEKGAVMMIASSDMNHYEPDDITRVKDAKAIDRILALDARGLYDVILKEEISMCGFGPAVAMLTAAGLLGATSAQVVKYATSAEISGDYGAVVGYAGVAIT
jgi:AmmeMemoRadiSam system protein B